ncbi:MAG: hypothetical protein ACK40I_07450 [Tabrizicola sp.]
MRGTRTGHRLSRPERRDDRTADPAAWHHAPDREEQSLAFCCLRQDFRRFKVQQMELAALTDEGFRPRRVPLLHDFIVRLRVEGRRRPPA